MEATGEVVRIRLLFEDENILNWRQRSEGLKQCWMIVKPHLKTIAEIASDISFTFHLHGACPYGLLLSMEGYTLPSTQPTSILKDKDIVSVDKKNASGKEILTNEEASIKDFETLEERLPRHSGVKLLAIDEFEKEVGGYQSEYEDNGTNSKDDHASQMEKLPIPKEFSRKKRKQSELARNSKVKNAMPAKHGNSLQYVAEIGEDEHIHKKHKKRRHSKEIPCDAFEDHNHTKALEVEVQDIGDLQSTEKIPRKKLKDKKTKCAKANRESDEFRQIDHNAERCPEREDDQVDVIITATESASFPIGGVKKSPSRSAKRKKAKRRWLREQKAKNQELVQSNGIVDNKFFPKSDKFQKSNQDDNIEAEEESLPVVVRPGHIRFLPPDEAYESQEIQDSMPVLQWNGITTKRQGQKWGKEKSSVNCLKEPVCPREEENIFSDDREEENISSADREEGIISSADREEGTLKERPLNFDELPSVSGLPQQGDIIAYRLVELSITSWCPELSCFRVGKIASYDCQSTKIRLVPVSEYPFEVMNSLGEEHAEETDISPYNEDGSLEIYFGSLVDVRWIHQQNTSSNTNTSTPYVKVAGTVAKCANGDKNFNSSADMNTGFPVAEEPTTATNANGDGEDLSVWEEINQAFSSKKAELALKEDQLEPASMDAKTTKNSKKSRSKSTKEKLYISKQGSGTPTLRTFKSLRGSALGPTMSLLRAQNILQ